MACGGDGSAGRRLAGLDFGDGELRTRLNESALTFDGQRYYVSSVSNLQSSLSRGLAADAQSAANLLEELEAAWSDKQVLLASLRSFAVDGQGEADTVWRTGKDTLAKTLLAIEPLQRKVAHILLEKVPEFADEDPVSLDESGSKRKHASISVDDDIARLALRQMKWMEFIVDSKALCEGLISILPICPPAVQEEIVSMFPEIADHSNQEALVSSLLEVKRESKELAPAILDTLSSLLVPEHILRDIIDDVKESLSTADCETLPAITRFLLRAVPPADIEVALHALRHNLADQSLTPNVGKLVLESLRSSFRLRREVADAAFHILRNLNGPNLPADIWILVALMESPARRKTAEAIFKKRASTGQISARTISDALTGFVACFQGLIQRLRSLASSAMQTSEPLAVQLGAHTYTLLYRIFEDGVSRQNILSSLLEHTGTRKPLETTCALHSLVAIAEEDHEAGTLLGFSTFLFGLLDFVESFTDDQLRLVFKLFGNLQLSSLISVDQGKRGPNLNLDIIVRKELTHVDRRYRRIGAIACSSLIGVLGESNKRETISSTLKICDLLFEAVGKDPKVEAMAYDEMRRVVSHAGLCEQVLDHIANFTAEKFENDFVDELGSEKSNGEEADHDNVGFGESCVGSLDSDGDLKVPLMRFASDERQKITVFCSLFGLVAAATYKRNSGALDEIDALLVCPVTCPPPQVFRDFADLPAGQQDTTVLCSIATINWIRELLNGFAESQDRDLHQKCLSRLKMLLNEEEKAADIMGNYAGSILPSILLSDGVSQKKEKDMTWRDFVRPLRPAALSLMKRTEADTTELDFPSAVFLLRELRSALTLAGRTIPVQLGKQKSNTMEELLEPLGGVGPQLALSLKRLADSQEETANEEAPDDDDDLTEGGLAEDCIAVGLDCICTVLSESVRVDDDYRDSFIKTLQLRPQRSQGLNGSRAMSAFHEVEIIFLQNEHLSYRSCGSVLGCLESLSDKANLEERKELTLQLSGFAMQLLKRPFECERKERKAHLAVVGQCIRTYARYSDKRLKSIASLVQQVARFLNGDGNDKENNEEAEREDNPSLLPSLHESSVSTFTKVLMNELVDAFEEAATLEGTSDDVVLSRIGTYVRHFDELVRLCKGRRETYTLCIRSGRKFVESFLKHGMPCIHRSFSSQSDVCVKTLRSFQTSTRFLQSLCNESKAIGDSAAMGLVPGLKKSLETVVYKVKALLEAHGGLNSFFLGNLKHRDLSGQVVSSQLMQDDSEDESDDDGDASTQDGEDGQQGDEEAGEGDSRN